VILFNMSSILDDCRVGVDEMSFEGGRKRCCCSSEAEQSPRSNCESLRLSRGEGY
jgi:hypothetical protein